MPNIAAVLKEEIARVARKELRGETERFKKASAQYRSDIAALKRRVAALEQQLGRVSRQSRKAAAEPETEAPGSKLRFSAKGLATQRKRLGLSAAQVAALLGVSGQSIYKWEDGKARPRASQLPAIATLRTMGKREATARLAALTGG